MNFTRFAASALAASFLLAGSAQAAVVTVADTTLSSNAGSYGPLDGDGTTLNVTGGAPLTTIGPGAFQGLWFGSGQDDATYTFTFNNAVSYFSILINAMSTFDPYAETIGAWTTNAASAASLDFTNIQFTAWDGSTVTSGPQDNGTFLMEVTAAAGESFTTVSFFHDQTSAANGSVVREIKYELAGDGGVVPEPGTWALLITGFFGAGAMLRRRTALSYS